MWHNVRGKRTDRRPCARAFVDKSERGNVECTWGRWGCEGCSRAAGWLPLRSCTLHTQNCSGKKLPRNRQMHTLNLIDYTSCVSIKRNRAGRVMCRHFIFSSFKDFKAQFSPPNTITRHVESALTFWQCPVFSDGFCAPQGDEKKSQNDSRGAKRLR